MNLKFWRPWQPRNKLRASRTQPDLARIAWSGRTRRSCRRTTTPAVVDEPVVQVPAEASTFCRETLGLPLDEWQATLVDDPGKRKAVLGARQCGKSTAVAGMAVHRMLTNPEFKVIAVAASSRQSALLVEKCKWMLRKAGIHKVSGDGANAHSVLLGNGSTIIALPCSAPTIRGFTADLLVMDEAAYIPDVVYAAARPMLAATQGDLVVMSSAHEPVGFFWELMAHAAPGWVKRLVKGRDVPRFTAEFLAEERRALGQEAFSREYECQFADVGSGVFQRPLIVKALCEDVTPLFQEK